MRLNKVGSSRRQSGQADCGGIAREKTELYSCGNLKGPQQSLSNARWRRKMRKPLLFVLLLSLLMPGLAMAQSAFDGTWKADVKTAQFPKKPDVYLLQDGMYHCKSCVPMIDVKADGQDQKVLGHPYYDTMSVKVVDDRTIETTTKKDGKLNGNSKT
jgi:hypothetical protein